MTLIWKLIFPLANKVLEIIVLEIITVTVVTIINSNNKSNKGSNNDKKVVVKKIGTVNQK